MIEEAIFANNPRGCFQNNSGKVNLVTKIGPLREQLSSTLFRQELAARSKKSCLPILDLHAPRRELQLRGHRSNSTEELSELAAEVPQPPELPAAIHEALGAGPAGAFSPETPICFLTPAGEAAEHGISTRVKFSPATSREPFSFESEAPPRLSFATMCTKGSVVVGPSLHVPSCSGLYPAKKFVKGETVCSGASVDGGWVRVEPGQKGSEFTLRLHVHHIFSRGFSLCMPLRRPPEERRSPRVRPVVGASWAPIGGLWELILGLLGGGLSGLLS